MKKIIVFIAIACIVCYGLEKPVETDSEGNRYRQAEKRVEICECEKHGAIEICECK